MPCLFYAAPAGAPAAGNLAEAAHAAEISLNHVVMKFHRSDFTDDTVGDFSARPSGAHHQNPPAPRRGLTSFSSSL